MPDPLKNPSDTSPGTPSEMVGLAGQALENLVNQFARPLDFLRELVQNSIDAGTPRVDVWLSYNDPDATAPDATAQDGAQGMLEIHVDDWGEGMDEEIIDRQLTRMFASTKEDDLTKIGKFGIGFTSIFAIHPDAVLLRTGRHGESWELLFHQDRSFDKVAVETPIAGTQITLFKRMPRSELAHFVRESRWILHFWCEHSDTPITFWDKTTTVATPTTASADPFADFAADTPAADTPAAGGPEQINSPLAVDADFSVTHQDQGVQVVVGVASRPRYGFYNGGLTLMNTENEDVLGDHRYRIGHLRFKVKSNTLEHTLTRDSVLQDEHWKLAMDVLGDAIVLLQKALLERVGQAVLAGESLEGWHHHIAVECHTAAIHVTLAEARTTPLLRTHSGRAQTLDQLDQAYAEQGATLLFPGSGPLADALDAQGVPLFDDQVELRELLAATWRRPFFSFGKSHRQIMSADKLYFLPQHVDLRQLGPQEATLLKRCGELLSESVDGRLDLGVAVLPGDADQALIVEANTDGKLSHRSSGRWRWLPSVLQRRTLLINRLHPYFLAQVVLAGERPLTAAFGLAQAVLEREGVEGEDSFDRLVKAATLELRGEQP
ncbi:MAG: hypothetical protein GXP62_19990 [Oligoflexia bacterium]|nr:hypothetical protein [Oligoflexia bacterium]